MSLLRRPRSPVLACIVEAMPWSLMTRLRTECRLAAAIGFPQASRVPGTNRSRT
jgi:hypothetical protein